MKAESTIRRELRRVECELMKDSALLGRAMPELYGAQQALAWALGQNVMAPCKSAMMAAPKPTDVAPKTD